MAVKKGDRKAQKALYDAYASRLLAISLRYVSRRDVAQDILHDAFIKVFNKIDTFTYRGDGSLRAWIERVTVNTALEWLRLNKRIEEVSLNSEFIGHNLYDEPQYQEVETIAREKLVEFISELPDGYRTVFNLFCVEGYSHKEIAQELRINEKSSSSQLLRAKKVLATKIKEYLKNNE